MRRTKRVLVVTLQILSAVFACEVAGCSDSHDPSTTPGSGGTGGSATGTGGSATGTGGASGASTGSGGTGGSTTGGGGSGGAGGSGAGGATDGGGGFSPLCSAVPLTMAGEAPTKGGVCIASDTQLCYKTCGPRASASNQKLAWAGSTSSSPVAAFAGPGLRLLQDSGGGEHDLPGGSSLRRRKPARLPSAPLAMWAGLPLDSSGASRKATCVCPKAGTSGQQMELPRLRGPLPSRAGC
jgi:hypothetical protein